MFNVSRLHARLASVLPPPPLAVIWLREWSERHDAALWCADQIDQGQPSIRCNADQNARKAVFLIFDTTQAVEFKLRFG